MLAVLALITCTMASCSHSNTGGAGQVTVGMEPNAVNALVYIALDQNYFKANGLSVIVKDYQSGLAATNGLLNDEVDIATAAEFVLVGEAFNNADVLTFATIDKFMHIYLVGRKDRGIATFSDLKGKKIGLSLKTASEFYLGRFLELNGIPITAVTLVNLSPQQSVDALLNGDVDAVIAWQPYISNIEDQLGNGAVKWSAQSGQLAYAITITSSAWAKSHPEIITRFLKALTQAKDFVINHQAEARSIVQQKLEYDSAYMAAIWPEYELTVSLDQSLITAMEDESRWMIDNNLTAARQTPDFMNYIYLDGLMAVNPATVNIIR